MNTQQNQAPDGVTLLQPGVTRRTAAIVDRGDTEHLVPGTHVTMDELHHYQLLGRRLQARAMAGALTGAARAVALPFRRLGAALGRARREGAAIRQLSVLDDHTLADIGLTRAQIPAAVRGLLERPARSETAAPVTPLVPRRAARGDAHPREAA